MIITIYGNPMAKGRGIEANNELQGGNYAKEGSYVEF